MANLVKYGKVSLEKVKEERAALNSGGGFLKLQSGKNVIRFIPPKVDGGFPFTRYHQHFIKLPGMERAASFPCPRLTAKVPTCPICTKMRSLEATGSKADAAVAKDLAPRFRALANVIARTRPDDGPQVLAIGKGVYDELLAMLDMGGDYDFLDPNDGFDINIEKSGSGLETEYKVIASRKTTPLHPDPAIATQWIEEQGDLTRYVKVPSDEEIIAMIGGGSKPDRGAQITSGAGGRINVKDAIDVNVDDDFKL